MENIITLTVNSTHFYLIQLRQGKLLVDAGWGLSQFTNQLKAYKIPFSDIQYIMFTHHHPDHAGLIQNVKDLSGARLIIHEKQIPFLQNLLAYYEKTIRIEKDDLISPDRAQLQAIGIYGEILETPGHSEDSISLALDSGAAFIGDLPSPSMAAPENEALIYNSWKKLISHNIQLFYHSHTNPIPVEQIKKLLSG